MVNAKINKWFKIENNHVLITKNQDQYVCFYSEKWTQDDRNEYKYETQFSSPFNVWLHMSIENNIEDCLSLNSDTDFLKAFRNLKDMKQYTKKYISNNHQDPNPCKMYI